MTEEQGGEHSAGDDAGEQGAAGEQHTSSEGAAGSTEGAEHWMDGLPSDSFDERDTTTLRRFNTVGDLARGYMNAFNLVARDKIPMPQNESEWQEVYDRLGRPAEAKDYSIAVRDELPEEFKELMSKNMDWFRLTAHELGLNADQAGKLYTKYTDYLYDEAKSQSDQIELEMREAQEQLKSELGESFEGKMTLANRAIEEIGGEDLISLFERTGMGRNPTVVKAFIKMGEMLSEEVGLDKEGQSVDSNEELDAQIAEIQANPAYLDAKAPEHKVLVDKMAKLMARRHPEPKQPAGLE